MKGDRKESLNLRVHPDLKRLIVEHAAQTGMSINTAAVLLLRAGLRAESAPARTEPRSRRGTTQPQS